MRPPMARALNPDALGGFLRLPLAGGRSGSRDVCRFRHHPVSLAGDVSLSCCSQRRRFLSLVDAVLGELRARKRARAPVSMVLPDTNVQLDIKMDKRFLRKGLLIEFQKDNLRTMLAVVQEPDGKKNWKVHNQNGALSSIKPEQVTFVVPGIDDFNPSDMAEFIRETQDLLDPLMLECAWMELLEEETSVTTQQLAEIIYGRNGSLECYATHVMLSRDEVYFQKTKTQGFLVYDPRSVSQVQKLKRSKLAKDAAQKDLEGFVHMLYSAKAAPWQSKPSKCSWLADEKVREKIESLQAYAIDACEDDGQKKMAENILNAAGKSKTSSAATLLLIDIGYFPVHVNLDLLKNDSRTEFSEEVHSAAEILSKHPIDQDEPIRRDLTSLKVYAIDVDEADELDDALSATRLSDGRIKVWIHVADPTCLVKPHSTLDKEALWRGSSIFLPTATFPMFPETIAMGIMSLQQGKLCNTVSVSVTLHPDGSVAEYAVENSVIRPTYMLTYQTAAELLYMNLEEESELRILSEAANLRFQWRCSQGAIDSSTIEARVKVANPDVPEPVINLYIEDQDNPAKRVVSEMMILCGEVIAAFGSSNCIPLPYRGQPQSNASVSTFARLPAGPVRGAAYAKVLQSAEMNYRKAIRHGALGVPGYVQFTSPIRRYVDLLAHYQVKAFLRNEKLPFTAGELEGMTFMATNSAKLAKKLSVSSKRYWLIEYMRQQPKGRTYKALVLRFIQGRMAVVLLLEVGIQASSKVPEGKQLGDEVKVVLKAANPREDVLTITVVEYET